MPPTSNRKTVVKRAAVVVGVVVLAVVAWSGFQVWSAWRNVERVEFETGSAREDLPGSNSTTPIASTTTVAPTTASTTTPVSATTTTGSQPLNGSELTTFLVVGTDDSTVRADVILLLMFPPGTSDAIMISIPRDLWVRNPCTGTKTKINENLFGCGSAASGPEQLAIAVEDFAGIPPIDHFAVFTFPGFEAIIDRVGGVEVCVGDYRIRDLNEDFDNFQLPAGCSIADGETALAWMRSRKTQQLTPAGWVAMPEVSDLTRNERQQEMLLAALVELKGIRSIPELTGLVEDLSDTFTIDEGLGLGDAIGFLWDFRSIGSDDIYRPVLDVRQATIGEDDPETEEVEVALAVLHLNVSFQETVIGTYPRAIEFFPDWSD
ncbi:MAG: LCP family protein [Acidimicrobiia bacterium]